MNLLLTVFQSLVFMTCVANVLPYPKTTVSCWVGFHSRGQEGEFFIKNTGKSIEVTVNGNMVEKYCGEYSNFDPSTLNVCTEHTCTDSDGNLKFVYNTCPKHLMFAACKDNDFEFAMRTLCDKGNYNCRGHYNMSNTLQLPKEQRWNPNAIPQTIGNMPSTDPNTGPTDAPPLNPFVPFDCAENICSGAIGSIPSLFVVVVFFTILLTIF
ncbi:hypothetical protein niasHT_012172 [Heterodera trifolii]|uniref:Uncharacterized protein n=1 Tax=Heterodera trifolii TaxID=157864 RepID=A0ABD2KU46_9BILA